MGIVLGANQYGKAEVRLVHVDRSTPRHRLTDLNVSTHLRGAFDATYLTGDNSSVLATDTQKNTVYAFARKYGVSDPEDFAIRLASHFVESQPQVRGAQIEIDELPWERIQDHDHAFSRPGGERRTTSVTRAATGSGWSPG